MITTWAASLAWFAPLWATPRGTVLIVHGLGEHVGRYDAVAQRLRAWGWAVRGHDHQGHGRSDGARGRLHTDNGRLQDLDTVIDATRAHPLRGQGPLVLLGHSMGGLVAACFVLLRRPAIDGLILSSPALRADLSATQKVMLSLLQRDPDDGLRAARP